MIGVIARMLKDKERVLELNERDDGGYDVRTTTPPRETSSFVVDEREPEAFIERVEYESGSIVVAPLVEALREWLKKGGGRGEEDETQTES